jgi:CheY-like chemotaxis protein
MQRFESVTFLLVDDDEIDALTMTRSMAKLMPKTRITVAHSGAKALALLRSGVVSRPFVVLVDIRMPEMSGHEFIAELRNDPTLKNALVFIVSTSDAVDDIDKAYDQNVAGYVVKNADGADFSDVVSMLHQYANVVQLPM